MSNHLNLLDPNARQYITQAFVVGTARPDLTRFTSKFPRTVDLVPLVNIVRFGMAKFAQLSPEKSDGWLAPRVHASVRLTRREAADPRVWEYLTVEVLPDYVRWRWEAKDRQKRFVGGREYINALARLWWGAELARNGGSYALAASLFQNQDLQNSWARCDLFHHRATAIASLELLGVLHEGKFATSDQIRDLVKSFNMAITTTLLDSVAPDPGVDAEVVLEWIKEAPDETQWHTAEPVGPNEPPVDPSQLAAVRALLNRVVQKTRFTKRDRGRAEGHGQVHPPGEPSSLLA